MRRVHSGDDHVPAREFARPERTWRFEDLTDGTEKTATQ
jgi:hypothetical protein